MEQICNHLLAPTPPMGWNSWDCFGLDVTEDEVKRNAEFMSEHLRDCGWNYIVIDMGWYAPGVTTGNYKNKNIPMVTDEYGRLIPLTDRFPSAADGNGFRPLADYIHSLGLKFGIHIMRGMPWIAAEKKLKIKGTDITCDSISDSRDQCLWFKSMYGIDMTKDGAQQYYDALIELYVSWGVDFIKADDMGTWDGDGLHSPMRTDELEALASAIQKHGNNIVLSISPGAAYLGNAYHLSRHAHMWRISCDFWDDWEALKRQFARCAAWSLRRVEGHWPDADMLPLGVIGIRGEVGKARKTHFNKDEQLTLMTLWCMFRSPLMFGGDMTQMDEWTYSLITNKHAIELNQHSMNNQQIYEDDVIKVWTAVHENGPQQYTAIFNTSDQRIDAEKFASFLGQSDVFDIWNQQTINRSAPISIAPHGALLVSRS